MKILVTGAAGFIGYHLSELLIKNNFEVIGLDNLNDYYSTELKRDRLNQLGINKTLNLFYNKIYKGNKGFKFIQLNIQDRSLLPNLFKSHSFEAVCNLAAQAGVRHSIENPNSYIDSNVVGFLNILECCRNNNIKHLVYASSSSVYGETDQIPFNVLQNVDHPISLYAATKKSNELMAYTYSHLYKFYTTGLRFFTVYGPWGRPDMAPMLFANAISKNKPINVFNHGKMQRDFTFVKDICEGIFNIIRKTPNRKSKYRIYNIGNNKPTCLEEFISIIENELGKKAIKNYLPLQDGDVTKTWAEISDLINDYNYFPNTSLKDGLKEFIIWYKKYYN